MATPVAWFEQFFISNFFLSFGISRPSWFSFDYRKCADFEMSYSPAPGFRVLPLPTTAINILNFKTDWSCREFRWRKRIGKYADFFAKNQKKIEIISLVIYRLLPLVRGLALASQPHLHSSHPTISQRYTTTRAEKYKNPEKFQNRRGNSFWNGSQLIGWFGMLKCHVTDTLIDWSLDWLIDRSVDCFVAWLIDWLLCSTRACGDTGFARGFIREVGKDKVGRKRKQKKFNSKYK